MNEEEIKIKKQEALVEYNRLCNENKKNIFKRFRKISLILIILLFIGFIIKCICGNIYFSVGFLRINRSVEYNMFMNGSKKNISFEDVKDSPIIPGLFYFRSGNMGGWYNMDDINQEIVFDSEKIVLDFVVNECYTHTDKVRVNCDSTNDKLIRKKVEPKFTRLFIRKNGKNEKVMYDGKFINNISLYVKEKGYYYIEIYAEYDGIDTKLYFTSKRKVSG